MFRYTASYNSLCNWNSNVNDWQVIGVELYTILGKVDVGLRGKAYSGTFES
jgi:hypothetical protein